MCYFLKRALCGVVEILSILIYSAQSQRMFTFTFQIFFSHYYACFCPTLASFLLYGLPLIPFFFFFLLLSGTGTPPLNPYIISLLYPSKIEYYQKAPSIKKSLLGTLNSNNTCGFKYYVISYFVKIKIKKFISL